MRTSPPAATSYAQRPPTSQRPSGIYQLAGNGPVTRHHMHVTPLTRLDQRRECPHTARRFIVIRLDGAPAFVGIVHKQDGTIHAVLLAEQLFVFKALRRISQATLIELMYLEHFTQFDEVQVIDKFKDPVVELAVKQLNCKLPVIVTEIKNVMAELVVVYAE